MLVSISRSAQGTCVGPDPGDSSRPCCRELALQLGRRAAKRLVPPHKRDRTPPKLREIDVSKLAYVLLSVGAIAVGGRASGPAAGQGLRCGRMVRGSRRAVVVIIGREASGIGSPGPCIFPYAPVRLGGCCCSTTPAKPRALVPSRLRRCATTVQAMWWRKRHLTRTYTVLAFIRRDEAIIVIGGRCARRRRTASFCRILATTS